MRRTSMALLSLAVLSTAGSARADEDRIRIAVVDFANRGASDNLVKDCNSRVNAELHSNRDLGDLFKVTSKDDIREMLSHEKDKALLGCEDASCLAEIGGALGVEYLVTGSVSKLDTRTTIDLRLVNIRKGSVDNVVQEVVDKGTPSDVVDRAGNAAVKLVSKIFASKQGFLALLCGESGATVKIDGTERATTPLTGRLTLAFGPHLVEVSKTGFLTTAERITIQPNQGVERDINMVPSPDFIDDYESKNGKLRTGAWIATTLAVIGAGAGGYFAVDANDKYDKFKGQQTTLQQNPRDTATRSSAEDLKSQVQSSDQIALISGGVALLSAGVATWLWVAGDNPDKYARWRVEKSSSPGDKTTSTVTVDPVRMALSFP